MVEKSGFCSDEYKKEKHVFYLIAGAILVLAAGLAVYWNYFSDYSNVLKINWGFSLPQESRYSDVYNQTSGASFNGDGIRYHVFSCENIGPINEMFEWQLTERDTIYYDSYSAATDDWLNKINVPAKERPDYAKCTYWYQSQNDNSEIILFLNKEQGKLYVVESFL